MDRIDMASVGRLRAGSRSDVGVDAMIILAWITLTGCTGEPRDSDPLETDTVETDTGVCMGELDCMTRDCQWSDAAADGVDCMDMGLWCDRRVLSCRDDDCQARLEFYEAETLVAMYAQRDYPAYCGETSNSIWYGFEILSDCSPIPCSW